VVAFLSQDWLEALRAATVELPAAPDASALVQYVVSGAPEGNVTYFTQFDEGRIVDAGVGKPATEPDLTVTLTYGDALRLAAGDLELSAAYMQGTVKVEGDMSRLFGLLPATHRSEYKAAVAAVAETMEH
jgi:hypothetical protein